MKLFDCYCAFGEVAVKPPKYSRNAEELLEVMEFCGIDEALVFHNEMKYGSPHFPIVSSTLEDTE